MVNNTADNTFTYKTVQRVCCADALIPLALEDIFEFTEGCEFLFEIPEEDYAKVKAKVYNYGAYGNYDKTKSKGFPSTGGKPAANVSKVKDYYYGGDVEDYDYYAGYGDYPYYGHYDHWNNVAGGTNAKIVTPSDVEDNWTLGNEAAADKAKYHWISSILRGFYKPYDTLLYADEEFKQIEAAASDFINAIELPEGHPYRVFSAGLQIFMSNLVESISDIHSGERSGIDKIADPSKALCIALASSIFAVEDSFITSSNPLSKELDAHGIKYLCLPERIAAYLEKF